MKDYLEDIFKKKSLMRLTLVFAVLYTSIILGVWSYTSITSGTTQQFPESTVGVFAAAVLAKAYQKKYEVPVASSIVEESKI
jgi:uncharacterized membrane protein